jgi:4-amino-4-deoxy-L-arabinose transferase-like glycosyltransferase
MRSAALAILLITIARVAYLIWMSPYRLVADEAQYWDWSRRLSASYFSKGPGIAWLIAASTSLLGTSEWSVRVPAALSFAVASLAVAALAVEFSPDRRTAGLSALIGILLVALVPAYQLSAILMTIDAPYIACWALATWLAWRAFALERDGRPSSALWVAMAVVIGLGFLFKYSMAALVPGVVLFAWLDRRNAPLRTMRGRAVIAAIVMLAITLPVIWWNAEHELAGLGHLIGYLDDDRRRAAHSFLNRPGGWTVLYLLAQIGIVGPIVGVAAFGLATRAADRRAVRFTICTTLPMLLGFLLVTFKVPVEANWPIAAYVPWLALVACAFAQAGSGIRWWRRATLAYGLASLLGVHAPLAVARLPVVGRYVPVHRFAGIDPVLGSVAAPIAAFAGQHPDRTVLIVAPSHNLAGQLAFYLPGRPRVASAGWYLGNRHSAYDYFDDVSLASERTHGRPAVLVSGRPSTWTGAFAMSDLTVLPSAVPLYATARFDGPKQR